MDVIETVNYKNGVIKIFGDTDPESPRSECLKSNMFCFKHRRYSFGDEQFDDPISLLQSITGLDLDKPYYDKLSDQEKIFLLVKNAEKIAVILPLYVYEHGGIVMQTTPFNCSWDSSRAGYIYLLKSDIIKDYKGKYVTKSIRDNVIEQLKSEVETYSQYLNGEVYGYTIHIGDEEVASCTGFHGTYGEGSSLLEDAKHYIDYING